MKASLLISLLAKHMSEYGDHEVFASTEDPEEWYRVVTHCWYNHGPDNGEISRIVVSSASQKRKEPKHV